MALFVNPYAITFVPGMRVRAVVRITEADEPHDPATGPCETGWLHCERGELGTVSYMGEFGPTVFFDRSGTGTLCDYTEVELVVEEDAGTSNVPFPQANKLDTIANTVLYVACGVTTAARIAPHLPMDVREGRYYADAARYLGFLEKSGLQYELTPSGRLLADADEATTRALLIAAMSAAPGVALGMQYLRERNELPSLVQVLAWVERFAGVSGETRTRRAKSLLSWLKWALDGCVDEVDCYAP